MKRNQIPPILLITVPLLMISPFLARLAGTEDLGTFLFQYVFNPAWICFPVVLVLNLFYALLIRWEPVVLAQWGLQIKLFLIPFYAFTVFFGMVVPLAIVFLFILDALLMVVTSVYGLRALVRARKDGVFGNAVFLILSICHFCFVADVIGALVLHRKLKQGKNQ